MVSLQIVQHSNSAIANLPRGLVALFIGATSGIGQGALEQFARYAPSARLYTVARPASAVSHKKLLNQLRELNPTLSYNLITADHSLISEINNVVAVIKQKETKLDFLIMSPGFIAFEGRKDTSEGLDPSMTTRYYSRLRALEGLLPLLNSAETPRVVSVLAAGQEGPINESDLDLKNPANWSPWGSSVQVTTMGTLVLEKLARENPRLSIVHWFPGPVTTPGLERVKASGLEIGDPMSQDEGGARALFLATNDRFAVRSGLVPVPAGLEVARKSGGGIFLVDPLGEIVDNEKVLSSLRDRNVDKKVWDFTQKVFAASAV